ncbi:MAG: cyclic nucleotide-binding/CBS domain-containing protein [Burkholderiales bacterium]
MAQPRTVRSVIEGQELLTAPASSSVYDAARLMKQRKVGAMLVLEDGKLAGIFTERDALFRVVADGRDPTTTALASVMTRNPRCIHPDKPFATAIGMMHDGQFRRVPVVENDRPIGMVSASDAMGPELENFMFSLIMDDQARDVLA